MWVDWTDWYLPMKRKRLGIVVFDEIEVLDFCGPFEVFSVTRLNEALRHEEPSPFEIFLIAQFDRPVITTGGMKIIPDLTFDNCPAMEILVIPGGWGTRKEMNNEVLLSFIRTQAASVEILASVCTGALVLGNAGLLDGLKATTHWRSLSMMRDLFPNIMVDSELNVIDQGRIITSAGISAGIDMALKVVSRYFGEPIARSTAKHMEYPFPESNARKISF